MGWRARYKGVLSSPQEVKIFWTTNTIKRIYSGTIHNNA
jgi:hypothetical protein